MRSFATATLPAPEHGATPPGASATPSSRRGRPEADDPGTGCKGDDRGTRTRGGRRHRPHQTGRGSEADEAGARTHRRRPRRALPLQPCRAAVQAEHCQELPHGDAGSHPPALGTKTLKDVVCPGDITALHHTLRDTPCTANQAMWIVSKMFTPAGNRGMLAPGRNRCRHVRYYREKSGERFLTPEEYRRLGGRYCAGSGPRARCCRPRSRRCAC